MEPLLSRSSKTCRKSKRLSRPGAAEAGPAESGAPLAAALAAGRPVTVDHRPTFVDGIGGRSVFPVMLKRARGSIEAAIVSSLTEVAAAMQLLSERAHVVAVGAGVCSVAAALSGCAGDGRIVCVASGGYIDFDRFAGLLCA